MRALALVVLVAPALPVEVTWQGEASCPLAGFNSELEAYLADSREPRAVRVTVEVREAAAKRWTAELVLKTEDASSRRALSGSSCAEVSQAAAFVTAVVVDPGVLTRPAAEPALAEDPIVPEPHEVPAPADPGPPEIAAPEPEPTIPRAPASEPARPRRVRGFVRPSGGFEAFGMPKIGPTVSLAGGVLGEAWRVEVFGMYRAPSDVHVEEDGARLAWARLRMWAVGARGCGVVRAAIFEVPLCAGLEAGQVVGQGLGYEMRQTDRIPWAAALVGPALAWAPRRWFALWLGVDAGVPLVGGRFRSRGEPDDRLYTLLRFSLRAGLGVEARF
ncbi:MAG: hypothetical protein JNL82_30920 [Myxococcales bacterium]|nr:hypothetical protein [Myxococcales bacterium]